MLRSRCNNVTGKTLCIAQSSAHVTDRYTMVVIEIIKQTIVITGFVLVMMLVIEYVNVFTGGDWQKKMLSNRWSQYFFAALLGASPGCLGAFAVVALYTHRMITLGAVVAAMVATAGDESFVMFAMIPRQAFLIHGMLLLLGIAGGVLTDICFSSRVSRQPELCEGFELHPEQQPVCSTRGQIAAQLKQCSPGRGTMILGLMLFLVALLTGQIGPAAWDWIRITLCTISAAALFMVVTVPEHFLEEHLWRHVVMRHAPRIFLWTLGAMLVIQLATQQLHLETIIQQNMWMVLLVACLVGLIPESGPHMVFIVLYAQGTIPMSILLASSIVQDGHGMLPMLAHSRRAFFGIKGITFIFGLATGAAALALGF